MEPPANARYTVKVVPGWSYMRQGETVCQVYQLRRGPVSRLEPRILHTKRPVLPKAREMAATMVLSNNPEKAQRAVAAMGFRAGLNPVELKDTIEAAEAYCQLVTQPKNDCLSESSCAGPGSDPASSASGLTPSLVVTRLGRVAMAGGLMLTLSSECACLRGTPMLSRVSFMIACPMNELSHLMNRISFRAVQQALSEIAASAAGRASLVSFLQDVPLLRIAQ